MKYAVLSDLHANLDALECALADARACGVEEIVCLGDLVGYGPLPAETLARIRSAASVVLAGNHDDAVSGRTSADDFIDLAGDAVQRHREVLGRDDLNWLKSLPHTAAIDGAKLVHGDLTDPPAFNYIDSEDAARANFAATDAPLVFVGHTHVPGIYLTGASGNVYALGPEDFVLEDGKRYIVNVGSVGYPREANGECRSSYVLYDSTERTVRFRSLPFAVSSVLQRGHTRRRRGLLAGLVLGLLVAVGATFAVLRWNVGHAPTPESVRELAPTAERTLALDASTRAVRANLKLQAHSPKALLTISFFDAKDNALAPVVLTGKSSTRRYKTPAGAVRATFAIRPAAEGETPVIQEFSPVAE